MSNIEVGKRIQALRKKYGYTQKELAAALQVTQSHISQVERGANISDSLVELLAEKFDVNPSYLLNGENEGAKYSDIPEEDYSDIDQFLSMKTNYQSEANRHQIEMQEAIRKIQASSACKEIIELFKDDTLVVTVPAIEDVDTIFYTKELMYPATTYTFKLDCKIVSNGFFFEAQEVDRQTNEKKMELKEPFEKRLEARLAQKSGGRLSRGNDAGDTVTFTPYHFELFSPFDSMCELSDGRKVKITQIGRYREAKSYARHLVRKQPKDLNDKLVDELIPDDIVYLPDGSIDRKAEFERFKKMIFKGVASKTLVGSGTRAVEGYVEAKDTVFDGQRHSLSSFGEIKIEYGKFVIDDRVISQEQLIELLSSYEGFTLEYRLKSSW